MIGAINILALGYILLTLLFAFLAATNLGLVFWNALFS
jgi:hypothetical protein